MWHGLTGNTKSCTFIGFSCVSLEAGEGLWFRGLESKVLHGGSERRQRGSLTLRHRSLFERSIGHGQRRESLSFGGQVAFVRRVCPFLAPWVSHQESGRQKATKRKGWWWRRRGRWAGRESCVRKWRRFCDSEGAREEKIGKVCGVLCVMCWVLVVLCRA